MSRHVHGFNESKGYCPETCADVDSAFSDAWDEIRSMVAPALEGEAEKVLDSLCAKVKNVGTEKLRDALCSAISDKEEAEGERDDARSEVATLEAEVAHLQEQVMELEQELAEAAA